MPFVIKIRVFFYFILGGIKIKAVTITMAQATDHTGLFAPLHIPLPHEAALIQTGPTPTPPSMIGPSH